MRARAPHIPAGPQRGCRRPGSEGGFPQRPARRPQAPRLPGGRPRELTAQAPGGVDATPGGPEPSSRAGAPATSPPLRRPLHAEARRPVAPAPRCSRPAGPGVSAAGPARAAGTVHLPSRWGRASQLPGRPPAPSFLPRATPGPSRCSRRVCAFKSRAARPRGPGSRWERPLPRGLRAGRVGGRGRPAPRGTRPTAAPPRAAS